MTICRAIGQALVLLVIAAAMAGAQDAAPAPVRQPLNDAWFTGPILAPSAATLPSGHFLIEPYLYDVTVQGSYDRNGEQRSAPHANQVRSLTYMLYGLTDGLTVGLIPTAGYNAMSGSPSSTGAGVGDLTLDAQYRLRQFHEGSWRPALAAVLQETLPTGQYDRLGQRSSNGLGGGAYTTILGLYSQTYLWLPNGRVVRLRLNGSQSFSNTVRVEGVSVYGTQAGFRGQAQPGRSSFADAAAEYSLTRNWVLALDATYRYNTDTRVTGSDLLGSARREIQLDSGSGYAVGLAPALEYNWKRNLGVIFGAYAIVAGRNTAATITPVVAINFVH